MSGRRITEAHKALLKPYAEALGTWADWVFNASDGDLAKLLAAAKSCTRSNCWWAEYAAAQILIEHIELEQQVRERNGQKLPAGRSALSEKGEG